MFLESCAHVLGTRRRRLQMVADAIPAQTDPLALGLIDGRYPSLDAAAEVLMSLAPLCCYRRRRSKRAAPRASAERSCGESAASECRTTRSEH
jgi:hypothetical protein